LFDALSILFSLFSFALYSWQVFRTSSVCKYVCIYTYTDIIQGKTNCVEKKGRITKENERKCSYVNKSETHLTFGYWPHKRLCDLRGLPMNPVDCTFVSGQCIGCLLVRHYQLLASICLCTCMFGTCPFFLLLTHANRVCLY